MTRRISLGMLLCAVACSDHSNDLGTIRASGGATVNVGSAVGGATQPAGTAIGGAATGGVISTGGVATGGAANGGISSTGTTVTGGFGATGGSITSGGVPTSGGASPTGGATATGGTGAFVLDLTCTKDTDCCIIYNACSSGFYLVTAAQQNALAARIASTPTTVCPACIPPEVVVSCDQVRGLCVGEQLSTYDPQSALSKPHCGPVADAGSAGGAISASSSPGVVPASEPDAAVGGSNSTGGTTSAPQTRFGCG